MSPRRATPNSVASFPRIAPNLGRLRCCLVDRPLREGEAGGDVAEHHAHAGPDANTTHLVRRGQLAVWSGEVADNSQGFVGCRLALLRVKVDEQDQIGCLAAEG